MVCATLLFTTIWDGSTLVLQKEVQLPIYFTRGFVKTLRIHIPWKVSNQAYLRVWSSSSPGEMSRRLHQSLLSSMWIRLRLFSQPRSQVHRAIPQPITPPAFLWKMSANRKNMAMVSKLGRAGETGNLWLFSHGSITTGWLGCWPTEENGE